MQFNTAYLYSLAKYAIKPEHVAESGLSYALAAWRIHMHIRRKKWGIFEPYVD
jgi:hypothetical protein